MNDTHRVLLVRESEGDEALIQSAFRTVNPSARVQVAVDGEEAIAYLSGQSPYTDRFQHPMPLLVLLGLKLRGKSGLEVLTWIRRQPALFSLPVVVMTASREPANINRAYELGANSYILKPESEQAALDAMRVLNTYWFQLNTRPQFTGATA